MVVIKFELPILIRNQIKNCIKSTSFQMSNEQRPDKIIAQKLIGMRPELTQTSIDEKDAILYAIGIGFSKDPMREQDYKYTNEFNQDFIAFPTIGAILARADLLTPLITSPFMPKFSPFQILHAEYKLKMIKDQIQVGRQYEHDRELIDCADKGKNAFLLFRGNSYEINQKGGRELAFEAESMLFIKGLGGFGFQGKGLIKPAVQVPSRKPDWKLVGQTYPNQAFIYRLAWDTNPLHIDPQISKAQNFERPIIHGLASYGTVGRVFVQQLLNNDPTRLREFQTRFVGHVYPGETLDISIWKEGETYIYQAQVKQRKTKALIGYIITRPAAKL